MSEQPRPWWASGGEPEAVEDVDPMEAFRTARRTAPTDPRGQDDGGHDRVEGDGLPGRDDADGAAPSGAGVPQPHWCGSCPLCTLARTLEDTRPELLQHLTEAGHHLAAALRALMEPPSGPVDPDPARSPAPGEGVQHIRLDQDPGPGPEERPNP